MVMSINGEVETTEILNGLLNFSHKRTEYGSELWINGVGELEGVSRGLTKDEDFTKQEILDFIFLFNINLHQLEPDSFRKVLSVLKLVK